jgi:hypothetical protein
VGVAQQSEVVGHSRPLVDEIRGSVAKREGEVTEVGRQLACSGGVVQVGVTGIGEPALDVCACFGIGVKTNPDQGAALAAELGVLTSAGRQDPAAASPAVGPPFPHGSRVGDIVQHHQPPLLGRCQPPQEQSCSPVLIVRGHSGEMQTSGRFRVRADDLVGVSGTHPHQHIQPSPTRPLLIPQLPRQRRRKLALAHPARTGQHHITAPAPRRLQRLADLGARLESRGRTRHISHPHRPLDRQTLHWRRVHMQVPCHLRHISVRLCLLTCTALPRTSDHHPRPPLP